MSARANDGYRGNMAAARAHVGLTKAGAARVLGVAKQTVQCWEDGTRAPSGESLRKMADAYDEPDLERLLERTGRRELP